MKSEEIEQKIILTSQESDTGLYMLLWDFKTTFTTELGVIIKNTTRELIENDVAIISENKWGTDEYRNLKKEEALTIIESPKNWEAPRVNDLCYIMSTTRNRP